MTLSKVAEGKEEEGRRNQKRKKVEEENALEEGLEEEDKLYKDTILFIYNANRTYYF